MRKQWTVETVNHHRTGLLIAISEDLPGLYVHGRTEEEVEERIPVAIRALLEAEGQTVGEIVRCDDETAPKFKGKKSHYAVENCYA